MKRVVVVAGMLAAVVVLDQVLAAGQYAVFIPIVQKVSADLSTPTVPTSLPTVLPTLTAQPTFTTTATATRTAVSAPPPPGTATNTATATRTATPAAATATPTRTATPIATATPTRTFTPTRTAAPATPTRTATRTPAPTATRPPASTPSPTPRPQSQNGCAEDANPSSAPNSPVKITAIDKVNETVTLQNVSAASVDLNGWDMCSVTGNQHHPIGGTLAPGQSKVFPGPNGPIWNNSSRDDGELYDSQKRLVSYFFDR